MFDILYVMALAFHKKYFESVATTMAAFRKYLAFCKQYYEVKIGISVVCIEQ